VPPLLGLSFLRIGKLLKNPGKNKKFYHVDKNFKKWHVPGTSRFHTSFDDTKEGRPLCQTNKISKN
jgi:hypothetical protein